MLLARLLLKASGSPVVVVVAAAAAAAAAAVVAAAVAVAVANTNLACAGGSSPVFNMALNPCTVAVRDSSKITILCPSLLGAIGFSLSSLHHQHRCFMLHPSLSHPRIPLALLLVQSMTCISRTARFWPLSAVWKSRKSSSRCRFSTSPCT